jgi:hypothetical protein
VIGVHCQDCGWAREAVNPPARCPECRSVFIGISPNPLLVLPPAGDGRAPGHPPGSGSRSAGDRTRSNETLPSREGAV